jgi:type IV pilus assembly protein PilW
MRSRVQPGLTLVELLVALAASAIVLVAVIAAVKAQQDAFNGGHRVREAQGSARDALFFVEQRLSNAGYGIDPVLAIDLSGQPGDPDATVYYAGPCPAEMVPCQKDRIDGSDELVFYYRNPNYWLPPAGSAPGTPPQGRVWEVVSFDAANDKVTLAARANDVFPLGQILEGVCANGAGAKFFTVGGATVKVGAADADAEIALVPDVLGDPFKRQSAGKCDPSRVYLVERNRFHVRPVALGDGNWESYLMLDTGVDVNGDDVVDERDEILVAPGIELLQVAYHFQFHAEGPNPAVAAAGTTPGVPLVVRAGAPNAAIAASRASPSVATDAPAPGAITRADFGSKVAADSEFYEQASLFPYAFGPPLAVERKTNHQGNIRAVQVLMVGRSSTPSPEGNTGLPPGSGEPLLNMVGTPPWIQAVVDARGGSDGLERVRFESTVNLASMVSRRLLFD